VNLPVDVDAAPYTSACSSFYAANHAIIDAVSTLNGTLDGCGAMAGSDTGGQAWADQYDGAARPLLQAGADLGESMAQMANLLNGSLINHKGAEYGAVTGEPPQYETSASDGDANPDHWTETLSASPPPSANGGTGDNPDWWHWLVDHLEGYLWPDADTRKLRGAGAAWVRCSETLTVYATSVESAKGSILNERSPEIADAAAACTELKGHVTDLSAAYAAIGKAANDYAQQVDDHHQMIQDELVSFLEWTAGIEIVGGIVSVFTVGIAEAPTQAVEAAEVANAASKVLRILRALVEIARTVAETIGTLLSSATRILGDLKKFLNAKVEKALVRVGEKLGWSRLSAEEKNAYETYARRKAAKGGTSKSPEEWKRLKDQVALNKANGDAYESEMMLNDGVTAGEDGWSTQVAREGRRWDYANETEQKAVEVKSGTTPVQEGLVQLDKDESALRDGWDVTWHLKKELSPTLMTRLEELSKKYPNFHYDISG